MTWRPAGEAEAATDSLREGLARAVSDSGLARREVDRRAGWAENYLSQLLRANADLKVAHVYAVLHAIGKAPGEFFAELHPVLPAQAGTREVVAGLTQERLDDVITRSLQRLGYEARPRPTRAPEAQPKGGEEDRGGKGRGRRKQ